jgi:DNA-binding NarL/FixJ family response regulator
VLLAEDHQVVRQALRHLVDRESDLKVVGEAGDGAQALELAARLKPDVLVANLSLPGPGGSELVSEARRRTPQTKVVVLSPRTGGVEEAGRTLHAGALGYVAREATAADLVRAVRSAAKGKRHVAPALSERAVDAAVERAAGNGKGPVETLTRRERLILQLSAEGNTCAEIAQRLAISRRTVETHRANMLRKLRLRGQSAVVRFALEHGVVTLEGVGNRGARRRTKPAAKSRAKTPVRRAARRR